MEDYIATLSEETRELIKEHGLVEWCKQHNASLIDAKENGFYYAVNDDFWFCPYDEM